MGNTAQAQEKSYNLHSLGWKSFQDLCVTIISEVLGQTVQKFNTSKDAGRDGAFHGTWNVEKGVGAFGSFTVQCKFTSKRDTFISVGNVLDELKKVRRLASQGLADNYILMTNYGVSGSAEAQPDLLVSSTSPEEEASCSEEIRKLQDCLSRLNPNEQELISLKFSGEMTNREISQVTGLSESNVGTILCRAVRKLRDEYTGWQHDG